MIQHLCSAVSYGGARSLAEIKERFAVEGLEPMGGSPADFAKFIASEIDKYAKIIKAAGIKLE